MTLEMWQIILGVGGSLVAGWLARHKGILAPATPAGPSVPVVDPLANHPVLNRIEQLLLKVLGGVSPSPVPVPGPLPAPAVPGTNDLLDLLKQVLASVLAMQQPAAPVLPAPTPVAKAA